MGIITFFKKHEKLENICIKFNYVVAVIAFAIYFYREFLLFNNIVSFNEKFISYSAFYIPLVLNIIFAKNEKTRKTIVNILFLYYIMAAINVLYIDDIFGRHFFVDFYYAKTPIRNMNLNIFELLQPEMFWHNCANMILLFPAGCFAYYLYKPLRNPCLYAYIFIVTDICIEALQFVFAVGIFDVTDVITNVTGATIAYLICYISEKIYKEKKSQTLV